MEAHREFTMCLPYSPRDVGVSAPGWARCPALPVSTRMASLAFCLAADGRPTTSEPAVQHSPDGDVVRRIRVSPCSYKQTAGVMRDSETPVEGKPAMRQGQVPS
jgi:hypothetical protein